MKIFWRTLTGWLLAIAAFNFWIDLPHRWYRTPELFTRNWTDAELWLTPEDLDETRFRATHIPLIPRPEVVVVGSSTALSTDAEPLRADIRFYNASIAGATTADYVFVWQQLKEA